MMSPALPLTVLAVALLGMTACGKAEQASPGAPAEAAPPDEAPEPPPAPPEEPPATEAPVEPWLRRLDADAFELRAGTSTRLRAQLAPQGAEAALVWTAGCGLIAPSASTLEATFIAPPTAGPCRVEVRVEGARAAGIARDLLVIPDEGPGLGGTP